MRWERGHPVGPMFAACVAGPMLAASLIGCSSNPIPVAETPGTSNAPAKSNAHARLQGTWELVTFISATPVSDEAVVDLSLLHGAVRLRFAGDSVTTFIPGKTDEERCGFEIRDEVGDTFTLITGAGMFREAQARFVSNDLWEATERGLMWPGTTRFQRVAK